LFTGFYGEVIMEITYTSGLPYPYKADTCNFILKSNSKSYLISPSIIAADIKSWSYYGVITCD